MGKAKLTDAQKAEAYRLYTENGYTYKQIAQEFDVSIPTAACAVSEYEKKHRWDDPASAPLACDQTENAAQSAEPAVPQSVLTAVEDSIEAIEMQIADTVARIKEQQRDLEAMRTRAAELRKWKEEQLC